MNHENRLIRQGRGSRYPRVSARAISRRKPCRKVRPLRSRRQHVISEIEKALYARLRIV